MVGLRGARKTTLGRMLAGRLGRRFLDSGHGIEQRCGVSVPIIFEIEGERGFRARETQVIAVLSALEGIVLATGGGAVPSKHNRRHRVERGTVVYLKGEPEELNRRLRDYCKRTGRCSPGAVFLGTTMRMSAFLKVSRPPGPTTPPDSSRLTH